MRRTNPMESQSKVMERQKVYAKYRLHPSLRVTFRTVKTPNSTFNVILVNLLK